QNWIVAKEEGASFQRHMVNSGRPREKPGHKIRPTPRNCNDYARYLSLRKDTFQRFLLYSLGPLGNIQSNAWEEKIQTSPLKGGCHATFSLQSGRFARSA